MITEDDIRHVAAMMRLDISDKDDYAEKVKGMLEYFDVLDSADILEEDILVQEINISNLRDDEHVSHSSIQCKSQNKRGHLRVPRLG
ncbi:MAG: hypothetical protein F4Y82_01380 [Cenarchaeum sp. SB0665_bin_23]|nr:hypothetical protein [Cenarchaeum sp. SB0667_bin_13]MXY37487.1 hypothetical protein [Cenarchaeum sp. SB0664_bin_35]MXY60755.1 hypothetical protein [Cenarchaeum sp. SB0665_bin_23]MXZ93679.1 hypothetical protein [Cenarchaeum sp. SB0666_bin_15]MYB47261.1 hypothetical protein [Cenarchaeum sp. SB0662_bin_33]MYC79334.1 hypothetical protein [Cenarchaeum sp. SB0661_bin_35]MYD58268.1 hypothetical protein [Cenarchaeum sp. SB0678_bin_8]MYG32672.1 hypothetical protein [Cenarchaeum sp. SB0677_bin_16]